MSKILITGVAGFIGFHVARRLLDRNDIVTGIDNLNDYYDVSLKVSRLQQLESYPNFNFEKLDLAESARLKELFGRTTPSRVINLAAQAGVRYSIQNAEAYGSSNLVGFLNVLEACRRSDVEHLVYASSSSVYGANTRMPFSVRDNVDHPVSLYAATKKANELMAHSYSHLYRLPVTGLRFFTVYGPWGRPDMAYFSFTRAIVEGRPIDVFNGGKMLRDFTYIDDIVEGVIRIADTIPAADPLWNSEAPDPSSSNAPYRIYNIGNSVPVPLLDFIGLLEDSLGRRAEKRFLPMQAGDVQATYADVKALKDAVGFSPSTPLREGIRHFVEWYKSYYAIA